MIKIENVEVLGWEHAIRGMRNPKNSWEKSDSRYNGVRYLTYADNEVECFITEEGEPYVRDQTVLGPNDHKLMMSLAKGGPVHAKYRRMITVYLDITAPLYWWKEFDTYKVGTVANSCSTMHKIHAKEFTIDDFSHEHLIDSVPEELFDHEIPDGVTIWTEDDTGCLAVTCRGDYHEGHSYSDTLFVSQKDILDMFIIPALNANREAYQKYDEMIKNRHGSVPFDEAVALRKKYWWQMIQLLPTSYNQKRTIMLNYEVLHNMYVSRKDHKLDCWRDFCSWIETLPYSEIITGEKSDVG